MRNGSNTCLPLPQHEANEVLEYQEAGVVGERRGHRVGTTSCGVRVHEVPTRDQVPSDVVSRVLQHLPPQKRHRPRERGAGQAVNKGSATPSYNQRRVMPLVLIMRSSPPPPTPYPQNRSPRRVCRSEVSGWTNRYWICAMGGWLNKEQAFALRTWIMAVDVASLVDARAPEPASKAGRRAPLW